MTPTNIRSFRRRYQFSQQELGDAIGMSAKQIGNLEHFRQPILPDTENDLKSFFSFVTLCAETGRL